MHMSPPLHSKVPSIVLNGASQAETFESFFSSVVPCKGDSFIQRFEKRYFTHQLYASVQSGREERRARKGRQRTTHTRHNEALGKKQHSEEKHTHTKKEHHMEAPHISRTLKTKTDTETTEIA